MSSAPLHSRESLLGARRRLLEVLAEQTSPAARKDVMKRLVAQDGHPLGLVLGLFRATIEEAEYVRADVPVIPEADEQAQALRDMPYAAYLRTSHWRAVRDDALRRSGHQCSICWRKDNLQVHHRDGDSYDRRGCERPTDVAVLCDLHHRMVHGQGAA